MDKILHRHVKRLISKIPGQSLSPYSMLSLGYGQVMQDFGHSTFSFYVLGSNLKGGARSGGFVKVLQVVQDGLSINRS